MSSFFSTLVWPVIQIVWLTALSFVATWLYIHYRRLVQGVKKKDLLAVLEKIQKETGLAAVQLKEVEARLHKTEEDVTHHLQKVGVVRFNPFAETGGNQSFCLALLDMNDSGLVISSLHSRESTRIYAKPVCRGKETDFSLSEEERQAVVKAKKIK